MTLEFLKRFIIHNGKTYVKDISDNIVCIKKYNKNNFIDDMYFFNIDDKVFYVKCMKKIDKVEYKYKVIHVKFDNSNYAYIEMYNDKNKLVRIYVKKLFKMLFNTLQSKGISDPTKYEVMLI